VTKPGRAASGIILTGSSATTAELWGNGSTRIRLEKFQKAQRAMETTENYVIRLPGNEPASDDGELFRINAVPFFVGKEKECLKWLGEQIGGRNLTK
jgi:hypothetical protein